MSKINLDFIKKAWSITVPYWKSSQKLGWLLLGCIIVFNLVEVYINVLINQWFNSFYNALQTLNKLVFYHDIIRFSYLAAAFIIIVVYKNYLQQMLTIQWRSWMTHDHIEKWLKQQNYYRMQLQSTHALVDNPDQRISEDISQFIELTLSLSLGLLNALVTLFSFISILWVLSGPFNFKIAGNVFTIPGYMVWVALVYAIVASWITLKIGCPLIALNFHQQRCEADFRFNLVRFRENVENIAFYKGELAEKNGMMLHFLAIARNYRQIMKQQKKITWFTTFYSQAAVIFPFLVACPRLFSKQIQLGDVMQISIAFGQVQGALSYLINAYTGIASWKATTDRLISFQLHMQNAEQTLGFKPIYYNQAGLMATALNVYLPNGESLLKNITLHLTAKQSILISGPSGCGKTSLLRTLAGIWPFASGTLCIPEKASLLFLTQKVYLPLGSLKEILYYPNMAPLSDKEAKTILQICQLSHLCDKISEILYWSNILSIGEQQRIAFARAILIQPDFLFLDESTAGLDEPLEQYLYELLKNRCPNTCVISVGHRQTLKIWHDTEYYLGNYA